MNVQDQLVLEECPCPLCGDDDRKTTPYRSQDVAVVRCTACDLWYLFPRPTAESMAALYADDEYFEGKGSGYDSYSSQSKALSATYERLLRVLDRRGFTRGSMLEVGCGYGFLLEAARPYFDECVGCDLASGVLNKDTSADQLIVGGPSEIPSGKQFDCVIATHVIEHIHDPIRFIGELFRLLRVGGWLVLAAPDMGSFWRKTMQRRWPSFKYPEHVVFYDHKSLSRLFATAKLSSLQSIPYPHAFPLSLVCEKLGIRDFPWLSSANIWLPRTTVALAGQRLDGMNL